MISCNEYDYIEIVCLYHYPIKLTLKTGDIINAIALDTQRNENRHECIKVLMGEHEQLIVLDEISKLQVSVVNPHFCEITFTQKQAID